MKRRGLHLALAVVAVVAVASVSGCSSSTRPVSSTAVLSHPISSHPASPVYDLRVARREAKRLLAMIRLPPGARRQAREPSGAGQALASYSVNVPVVPHLVDLHEYFVVSSSTPADVIDWMQRHPPERSVQGDYGTSSGRGGGQWTSFVFRRIRGFAIWPDLVANAVAISGGEVAVRVDAQSAPRPRLPSNGRGPGELRVVFSGLMHGPISYRLRCDPSGGTVPDAPRVCAAIAADPALLYSFPGPDHSCPPGGPAISLTGTWNGKPLRSSFSVCTGGQEQQAGRWAELLQRP
jgi:hypothetical protein